MTPELPGGFVDLDGNEIEYEQWITLMLDHEARLIAYDVLPDSGIEISTVWLGVDLSFGRDDDPPRMFETMVFGGPLAGNQWKWPNRHAARAGHDQVLAEVKHVGVRPSA